MKYDEAISKLKDSDIDDKESLLSAIQNKVETVIGEKRKVSTRVDELEGSITSILKEYNAEGEDLFAKVKNLETKLKDLSQAKESASQLPELQAKLTQLEQERDSLKGEIGKRDRTLTLRKATEKFKANPEVLEHLLASKDIQIEVEGENVFVKEGDKKIEFVEYTKSNFAPFLPSIFPSSVPTGTRLPTGGVTETTSDEVEDYLSSAGYGYRSSK